MRHTKVKQGRDPAIRHISFSPSKTPKGKYINSLNPSQKIATHGVYKSEKKQNTWLFAIFLFSPIPENSEMK
jgi:hypothetical protein